MATDATTGRESDPEIEAVTAAIEEELGSGALNAGVHWTRLAFFAADFIEPGEHAEPWSIAPLIRRVARALRAPLDSLGIDHTKVENLDTYLAVAGGALEWAFRSTTAPGNDAAKPSQED